VTPELRRLLFVAAAAAILGLVHELFARVLAAHDLLGALLNRFDPVTLMLGVAIAVTRMVLLFFVPGWLAYRTLRAIGARVIARRLTGARTTSRRV
jgi:hypothetical protein